MEITVSKKIYAKSINQDIAWKLGIFYENNKHLSNFHSDSLIIETNFYWKPEKQSINFLFITS